MKIPYMSLKRIAFAVLLIGSFFITQTLEAQQVQTDQELQTLVQRIEEQRLSWFGIQSKLQLQFKTETGKRASCTGDLTYLRLNEKMRINCYNENGEALFIFQTHDVNFELFFPAQNKIYKGSIFDLENNDDFHSHIKPYDIYQAIKPFPLRHSELSPGQIYDQLTTLYLWKEEDHIHFMHRKLRVENQTGNVHEEFFYHANGDLLKTVQRHHFQALSSNSYGTTIYFPATISIHEEKTGRETVFGFYGTDFLTSSPNQDWNIQTRSDTETFTFPKIETQFKRHGYFS